MASLRLQVEVEGEPDGRVLDLEGDRFLVGRGRDCKVRILTGPVSRHHLVIALVENRWIAQDLDSSNGTFLNGERINASELRSGDELRLGEGGARFKVVATEPAGRENGQRFFKAHRK